MPAKGISESSEVGKYRLSETDTMSSGAISSIVLASVFGGALAGMLLRRSLPQDHLSPDSKETVKLAIALVSTMSALGSWFTSLFRKNLL